MTDTSTANAATEANRPPWLPDTAQDAQRAARTVVGTSNREEANDYRSIVAVLNSDWRVIECRDGIQWIVQRQSGSRDGKPTWRSQSYCRRREPLIRLCESCGEIDPTAAAILAALPKMTELAA